MKFKKVYTIITMATIVAFSALLMFKSNLEPVKVNAEKSKSISYPHQPSVSEKNTRHKQDYLAKIEKEKVEKKATENAQKEAEKQKATEDAQKAAEQQKASEAEESNSAQSSTNATQSSTVQDVQDVQENVNSTTTDNNAVAVNNTPTSTINNEDHSSGFNFGSYHFPLGEPFVGSGQVPATAYVYPWVSKSNWYLLEQGGAAGQVVKSVVTMGTAITVNGRTYHVTDLQSGLERTTDATNYMWEHIDQHAIGFQTCDDANHLTLYFAD